MQRLRKGLIIVTSLVVVIPLLLAASLYACEWYFRLRAEQLLEAVRTVTPGVTTQAEYMQRVHPFAAYLGKVYQGDGATLTELQGAFGVDNVPEWAGQLMQDRVVPETAFWVIPSFKNGVLSSLNIREMQGSGHPYGAMVRLTATQFEDDWSPLAHHSDGYWTQELKISGTGRSWETHVDLDERAITARRNAALDFRFHCFTDWRPCKYADQYLQPAPAAEADSSQS